MKDPEKAEALFLLSKTPEKNVKLDGQGKE